MNTHFTIVLPTYNERENLPQMLDALLKLADDPAVREELHTDLHILVVDDNSPDGTGAIADEWAAQHPAHIGVLHRHEKNGLGPAYVAGFKWALAQGADLILQMDTDFSHQPHYVPQLLRAMAQGADVVFGSRFARGGGVDENWSLYRKMLTRFANGLYVRLILNMPVADATGGFRLWKRDALIGLDLDRIRSSGYVFQVEIAYVAHRLGYRLAEVPIYFPDRERGTSKMSLRIQLEAALRVWQVWWRHRRLNVGNRRREAYPVPAVGLPLSNSSAVPASAQSG